MQFFRLRPALLWAALLLGASVASAQVDTAAITGSVSDPSGATIVAAEVEAVNVATGLNYNTQSNASGIYTLSALPIGTYDLTVASPGFQTVRRPNVTLNAGTRARIDITLQVGQVTEVIEVTGEVPLLESETSSLGQVIENKTITQMPLNGRNYQELALLSAGVLPNRTQNFVEDGFSANGAGFDQNVFTLDGADNNNYFSGIVVASNQAVKPSIDAVQEFKLETHTYGAEFGRGGGAVMQISTKSGTNEFHGTLFEFLRNEKLDSNNFFNRGRPIPPFRQNQFGGTVGGPIIKDRMFFFFSYEGTRIREKITRRSTIPTRAQVGGDFAGVATIYDPASQREDGSRDPFPNNLIPNDRIDPVAFRLVDLYPAPNVPGTVANNYLFNASRDRDDDKIDWKYDYRITDNHSVFVRHSYLNFDRLEPGNLPLPASGGNTAVRLSRGNTGVVNWTAVLGGTKVNELRVGYNRLKGGIDTPTQEQLWKEFGFQGLFDREDINGLPVFRPTGYRNVGDRNFAPDPRKQDVRQFVDTFSWNKGKHSLKMGVNLRNYIRWSGITNFARGRFDFNRQFTRSEAGGGTDGDAIADALLGLTSNALLSNAINARRHAWSYETYFQDTWKATQKLTLNLGLRYEQQTPYTEQNLRVSNFVIDETDPSFGALVGPEPNLGRRGVAFIRRNKTDFGPRIGLAYQLTDKTVIRTGYGVFYLGTFILNATQDPTANPPFYLQSSFPTSSTLSTSNVIIRQGFSPGALDPNAPIEGKSLFGAWPGDFPNGMTNQWNFNIQHSLPGNALFSIAYVGSTTAHQHYNVDLNQPEPGAGPNNPRRWFPEFSNLNTRIPHGASHYNGLEIKAERRFTGGFSFLTGFTWSKTMAKVQQQRTDINSLAGEWALSRQHMPQRFFFSAVYDLPFGKGRKYATEGLLSHIVGGWQLSPIFELQRGLYSSPSIAGNPANTTGGQRPDRIGDHRIPRSERTADLWYDPDAFAEPAPFTFGNSGAWIIEGPGLVNLDLMVNRTFRFNERISLDFRTELFNLTNRTNLAFPNATVNNPNAGTITETATSARQIQFGMKLIF